MAGYSIAFLAGVLVRLLSPWAPAAASLWAAASAAASSGTLTCIDSAGPTFATLAARALEPTLLSVLIALALVMSAIDRRSCRRRRFWLVLAAFCGGLLHAGIEAHEQLRLRWPESRSGERAIVEAIVESIPVAGALGTSFEARVLIESPRFSGVVASERPPTMRVRMLWRDRFDAVRAGERWRLLVSLQPPRSHFNPGANDSELQLFRERIHALGVVVESRLDRRLDAGHRPLASLRERIVRRIEQRVVDRDAAALIAALGVGATGEMSRDQWRVFNATGTTHLVAISGLHVTLFALIALALARRMWRLGIWKLVRVPREPFAAWLAIAASTAYALLAGFSVPTQRTLIMLAVWLLARSSARACGPLDVLGAALLAVLALDPFAPLAPGFWLSFIAIGSIVLVTHGRLARRGALREAVIVQLAVSAALVPVTLASFGSVPTLSMLVNAVAIPFFSFLLVPLVLVSIVTMPFSTVPSSLALDAAAALYGFAWPWLSAAADAPFAVLYFSVPGWWPAAAVVAIMIALMPWPVRLRVACMLWLLPSAVTPPPAPGPGALEATVLDVGQATAIVLRTSRHALVYDVGDGYGGTGSAAEHIVLPFLRAQGVRVIDRVVLNPSPFGSAGLSALLSAITISDVMIVGAATEQGVPGIRSCRAGAAWNWDGVNFRVLYPMPRPTSGSMSEHSRSVDDRPSHAGTSCVIRVSTAVGSLLLTGQIDAEAERQLVRSGLRHADVVVVPRRGSDSASTPPFIAATDPRWAIVSGSRDGQRGRKPAIERWMTKGVTVLATDDSGAVLLRMDPAAGSVSPRATREIHCALWRAAP